MLRRATALSEDLSPRSFAVAGLIMAIAVAARGMLDPALPNLPPFVTLYPAVALVGLLCGPVAGGAATVIAVLAACYFWIPPRLSLAPPDLTGGVTIALFVAASAVVLWASAIVRGQLSRLGVASTALELGLEVGMMGAWEIDLATNRITASGAAYRLHGLPEGEPHTKPEDWLRNVEPGDVEVIRESLQAAIADGGRAIYTYRVSRGAEGPRWISVRGQVVMERRRKRLICALADITEQMQVQQDLARERERLKLALEAGALAVWDFDPDRDLATIDARYAATLGLDASAGPLSRADLGAYIHPDDRAQVAREHDAAIAADGDYRVEYRMIDSAGQVRQVVSKGLRIPGATPRQSDRWVGVIQDITEQTRRERELQDLAAARELLVREADHRIKNSLQMVVGLLQTQMRGVEDTRAAEALQGAISRVGAIAASHLALQGSHDLREIELGAALRELCAHFANLHPTAVVLCQAEEPLMLNADRAIPFGLLVSELLTNALRHAFPDRSDGTVTVEVSKGAADLIVLIRDDGVGMASAPARSGLGSRIIRSLAAQLGAQLDIETAPGAGTAVTLRLAHAGVASTVGA